MTRVALIGTGPAGFGFLSELAKEIAEGRKPTITHLDIFDKAHLLGAGLPYNPSVTDPEHFFNVTSDQISVPQSGGFAAFLKDEKNREEIVGQFRGIFDHRFRKKFHARFGLEFSGEAMAEPNLEGKRRLKLHYDSIWKSFEARYLNFETAAICHPRILFGIYTITLFEEMIAKIRAAGIEVNLHPTTEITAIARKESGALTISSANGSGEFDQVVIASGRPAAKANIDSPQYITEIWPAENLRDKIHRLAQEEMAKRRSVGDENKRFEVAIQGGSYAAIDLAKAIFADVAFTDKGVGGLNFIPVPDAEYQIRVHFLKTDGMMPQIRGRKPKVESPLSAFSSFAIGANFDSLLIRKIAEKQGRKLSLWQAMLMAAIESFDEFRMSEKLNEAKAMQEFCEMIINAVTYPKKISSADFRVFFEEFRGNLESRFTALCEKFELRPEASANYDEVLAKIVTASSAEKPMFEQWKSDLENPQRQPENLAIMHAMQKVFLQFAQLSSEFVSDEDRAILRRSPLSRIRDVIFSLIPEVVARELIAMHEAGVLDVKIIDRASCEPELVGKKIAINCGAEGKIEFDAMIPAIGFTKSNHKDFPLYRSMLEAEVAVVGENGEMISQIPNVHFCNSGTLLGEAFKQGKTVFGKFTSCGLQQAEARPFQPPLAAAIAVS